MSSDISNNDMISHTDKKRKLDFTCDEVIWQHFPPPPKRKKKKRKSKKKNEPIFSSSHESQYNSCSCDNVEMNNLPNFAMVDARPENLASTPEIFNKTQNENGNKLPDTTKLFYLDCISDKCFSSHIRNRFINFIKACDSSVDKQTNVSHDSKKNNKNKIDPALLKFQKEQAEFSHKDKAGKKTLEELVDQGLKAIEDMCERIDVNQKKEENQRNEVNWGKEDLRNELNRRKEENRRNEANAREEEDLRNELNRRKEDNLRYELKQRNGENPRNKEIQMGTASNEGSYNVDIYQACVEDTVIFHMHFPSQFNFHGEIKITVIAGEIEILGCPVNESTLRTVDVHSPNLYIPLIIECKEPEQNYDREKVRNKIKNLLDLNDVDKILNSHKSNDAILLIEQIKSKFGGAIDLYFHKSLFSKDLVDFSSVSKSLRSLQSTFNFGRKDVGIRRNPQWDGIPMAHCSVICGGQGVGKSTLLKYFVNKALSQNKKVLCLDFDPGQPEFTPSGCLSAVIVDKPLLGPNFSHLIDPEIMVYFGGVDVSYSPSLYLEGVKYVIEKCRERKEFSDMTWFVNTMGFNRGVGVDLMTAIIKLMKPDIVVQIRSSVMKKNYPCYFTPRHVNNKENAWSALTEDIELWYDLRVVNSVVPKGKKSHGGLSSKQLRDILFFSYFSKIVSPPTYSFNAVIPYRKSFSNLYLGIESLISPREVLKAFNGGLVSLSHFEHGSEEIFVPEAETDDYFKIVVKPSISPSFGLGLIRGINVDEKEFYVLTHLSSEKLEQVNCLSLGRIHTPYPIFLNQEGVTGQIPYTCVSTIDSIQKVNRLFPNPPSGSPNDK